MGLFSRKSKSYLGVDIGSASIKIIELERGKRRPQLRTYGYADSLGGLARESSPEMYKQIGKLLRTVCDKAKATSRFVIGSLPSLAVFTSVISIPKVAEKDVGNAVRWEAKKFVPMNLDDVILDWRTLPKETKAADDARQRDPRVIHDMRQEDENIEVLLTAAPRNLVKKYLEIFKHAALEPISLETESFAIARALLNKYEKDSVLVIDIGAVSADVMVIEDGIPMLSRSIDVGGDTITQGIANRLNIDLKRAEQFKRDVGLASASVGQQGVGQMIFESFRSVIDEVRYTLELYHMRKKDVSKVILCGGSAYLTGLSPFLEDQLNLKVIIGDPWIHVAFHEELKGVLQELGPRYTVAAGLALRELL